LQNCQKKELPIKIESDYLPMDILSLWSLPKLNIDFLGENTCSMIK
jgi:hypothetical protein